MVFRAASAASWPFSILSRAWSRVFVVRTPNMIGRFSWRDTFIIPRAVSVQT